MLAIGTIKVLFGHQISALHDYYAMDILIPSRPNPTEKGLDHLRRHSDVFRTPAWENFVRPVHT